MHLIMHWDTPIHRNERGDENLIYTRDGEPVLTFRLGAPQNRNFYRDLTDCRAIFTLVQEAHAAGLRGECLTTEVRCTPTVQEMGSRGVRR